MRTEARATTKSVARQRESLKFILNGNLFNTATATRVAVNHRFHGLRGDAKPERYPGSQRIRFDSVLFQTAKGNVFPHEHTTVQFRKGKSAVEDCAMELSLENATEWVAATKVAILDSTGLLLPDEA